MDKTSLIALLLIIFISAIVFIFFNNRLKQKTKKKLQVLEDYAKKQGFNISESEVLNNIVIGIDKVNNKVFFKYFTRSIEETIDLNSVKKSQKTLISRNAETYGGRQVVTEKLSLTLMSNDPKKENAVLEFYSVDKGDHQLFGEPQFIDKWVGIINKHLAEIQKK